MGVQPAIFESAGQRSEHIIPGSYSRSGSISTAVGVSAGNLCILGKSTGGEPNRLLSFSNLAEAKDVLISGELLKAVALAFNGSSNYVPSKVNVIRVNNATQSQLTLKNSSTDMIKIKSWDWGTHCNQLKMWVSEGTTSGSTKIQVGYKEETKEIDNILRESISIIYTGSGDAASVSISKEGIALSASAEDVPIDEDTLSLSFDDYETLEDLVSRINDHGSYVAAVVDTESDRSSAELDTVSSVSIIGDGAVFKSNFAAFCEALKEIDYFDSFEILDTDSRVVPDYNTGFVYFTGGTIGNYTITEWVDSLALLETHDIQIVTTPSTDPTVHQLIKSHCATMSSTVNKKERTFFLGGAVGETDDDALAAARGFNSRLGSYVSDSADIYNPLTGEKETFAGAYIAVMLAGMESGMAVNEPLTKKSINVLEFTKKRSITNIETLIQGGVLVCQPDPDNVNNFVCIRAVTTNQTNELIDCERSMVREDLYMNKDLRSQFNSGIGTPNVSVADIEQTLIDTAKNWATNGYIIPKNGENVWNISIKQVADKVYLRYSRYLVAPRNFVFTTAINHVYTSTVEL